LGSEWVQLKLLKISLLSLLSVTALVVIVGAAFFWRLSQGPVPMSFLNGRIEAAINHQLQDMNVTLGDAVFELDQKNNVPHVRFRNLVLRDTENNVIASAPRAAVSLDLQDLLTGKITADSLELIGPKISARRNLDGSLTLGVGGQANNDDQTIVIDENFNSQTSKDTKGSVDAIPQGTTSGAKLIALLDSSDTGSSVAALKNIRISQASLNVFDDANAANWFAPSADLTFQKMPYGFVVLAKADVATKANPWHAEISLTYQHATKTFTSSTTIENLVPANVAEKIFALSQFAKVKIPLSGHVEIEAKDDGTVTTAYAELRAAAGELNLPEYLAQPIIVDDGNFRVNYEAGTGVFDVVDSSMLVGGTRAEVTGKFSPLRSPEGKLIAVDITLQAKNVSLDTQGTEKDPVLVDRIEFSGRASTEQARLDINDLVVMSQNTGVRMRGIITEGENSPGIQMAGRVRDISANLLKKIWPPIVAPKSRKWITDNVVSGRVTEGTFQVNLPANALANAQRDRHLPDKAINFSFSLDNVTTHYFKDMPVIVKAKGVAKQQDNNFDLLVAAGETTLESGRTVMLEKGSFAVHDIMQEEVQGVFAFDLEAPVDAMVDLASQPDLNMVKTDLSKFPKVNGTAKVAIDLQFPLIKNVPKDRVQLVTKIAVTNASIPKILAGIDLTDGDLKVELTKEAIAVSGPAKVNGLDANVTWKKLRTGGTPVSKITTTLDEKTREKLGLKIADYLSGPTPVEATLSTNESGQSVVKADVDLSKAKMKLQALGWKREAQSGTTASFTITATDGGGRSIDDFTLDGPGLHLRGNLDIAANGKMKAVTMDEIRLDDDSSFSARVVPGDGTTALTITGKNFDARPYIKTLISPVQQDQAAAASSSPTQDFTLDARFSHVTAFRGEAVNDVVAILRARGGKIAEADISGTFISGQPIKIKVTPLPTGRDMKVYAGDGGATVRAANFYSKIAGGELQFSASIGNEQGSPLRNGQLQIKNFEVRNEAALAELDQRGKPKKSGPRKGGITFKKLWLPFEIDAKFVRLGDVILRGTDMCATADGVIRKKDGALDITGSVIPACGLTGALNNVPLLGDILSGGNNNEGLFGVTYAMGGTLALPKIQVNPLSALAPGIFRRFFDFTKGGLSKKPRSAAEQTQN
jgi:Protein of unknown function/AsmA-like C-terminal region